MAGASIGRMELAPEQWMWTKNSDPPFHKKAFDKNLVKYHDILMGEGKTGQVFVPLCGKTLDMIFLADQGHDVVGLEFSKIGIEDFFAENGFTYTEEAVPNKPFVKYTIKEKRITIYRGDLFDLDKEVCGEFDASWDRGSFVAINVPTREKYAALMSSLIKKSGKILMEIMDYDPSKYNSAPHVTTENDLKKIFTEFEVKILESRIMDPPPPFYQGNDITLSAALLTHCRSSL